MTLKFDELVPLPKIGRWFSTAFKITLAWISFYILTVFSHNNKNKIEDTDEMILPRKTPMQNNYHSTSLATIPTSSIPPSLAFPKKTLILDLDETLVHSSLKPNGHYDFAIEVFLDTTLCVFYVNKRPNVELFLREISAWYDIIYFTASLQAYADPVIDRIDPHGYGKKRLFRESCLFQNGCYIKDLEQIGCTLPNAAIIDNSPVAYSCNKENAIPIESYFDNKGDDALVQLLPFLSALRFQEDIRPALRAKFGHITNPPPYPSLAALASQPIHISQPSFFTQQPN